MKTTLLIALSSFFLLGCANMQSLNSSSGSDDQIAEKPIEASDFIRVDTLVLPFSPYKGPIPTRSMLSYPGKVEGETVYVITEEAKIDVEIVVRDGEVVINIFNRYNNGLRIIDEENQLLNMKKSP